MRWMEVGFGRTKLENPTKGIGENGSPQPLRCRETQETIGEQRRAVWILLLRHAHVLQYVCRRGHLVEQEADHSASTFHKLA